MKRLLYLTVAVIAVLMIANNHCIAQRALPPIDLTSIDPASQRDCSFHNEQESVGIGYKAYYGYISSAWGGPTSIVTWLVPKGYSVFEAYVGMDDKYQADKPDLFRLFIEGEEIKKAEISSGQKAEHWRVPVTGGQSVSIEMTHKSNGRPVIAVPKFLAETSSLPISTSSTAITKSSTVPAPFVVDPNDLDKLSVALRKRIDAKLELKTQVSNSNVALMTFSLVDINSQSVATNVAEDLYTSMINNDFRLVERGQLDKILKELKIQDTALIDPATAKKIGQMSGCDLILVGSVSDRGQFVVINCRLLETATGKALAAERVETRKIAIKQTY